MNKKNNSLAFDKAFLYSMHQIYFMLGKRLEKLFASEKLFTLSQFWVMHCIRECAVDSESSQSEISKAMFVSEATISKHIEKLKKQKFLTREIDKKNRRKHILNITDKGKILYEKSQMVLQAELDKIFYKVNEKDKNILLTNFQQIIININNK